MLQRRERFEGMDEAAICERIVRERLTFKEAVGRLPAGRGLTLDTLAEAGAGKLDGVGHASAVRHRDRA